MATPNVGTVVEDGNGNYDSGTGLLGKLAEALDSIYGNDFFLVVDKGGPEESDGPKQNLTALATGIVGGFSGGNLMVTAASCEQASSWSGQQIIDWGTTLFTRGSGYWDGSKFTNISSKDIVVHVAGGIKFKNGGGIRRIEIYKNGAPYASSTVENSNDTVTIARDVELAPTDYMEIIGNVIAGVAPDDLENDTTVNQVSIRQVS